MTINLSPPRKGPLSRRSPQRPLSARPHAHGQAPACSLKARPLPHPQPAPSWEELLGQR